MSYELAIHPNAEREWGKLDDAIKRRFRQKLQNEQLIHPRVAKDALHGLQDVNRIKITTPQFRLAYHVNDANRCVTILAVSNRTRCTRCCIRGIAESKPLSGEVCLIHQNNEKCVHWDSPMCNDAPGGQHHGSD